jgi:hypothetical protein
MLFRAGLLSRGAAQAAPERDRLGDGVAELALQFRRAAGELGRFRRHLGRVPGLLLEIPGDRVELAGVLLEISRDIGGKAELGEAGTVSF